MSRSVCNKGGNDEIYTPLKLCDTIVSHYKPSGKILEPCSGSGNFVKAFNNFGISNITHFDIKNGIDFLTYKSNDKFDWVITNPPFSLIHKFIIKCMELEISDIVFLCYANTFMMNGKFNSLKKYGYSIVEMAMCKSPHYHEDKISFDIQEQWVQSGFALSATHIKYTNSKDPMNKNLIISYLDW